MGEKALDFSQTSCPMRIETETNLKTEETCDVIPIDKSQKAARLTILQQKLLQELFKTGLTSVELIESLTSSLNAEAQHLSSPTINRLILKQAQKEIGTIKHVGVSAIPSLVSAFTQTENPACSEKPW